MFLGKSLFRSASSNICKTIFCCYMHLYSQALSLLLYYNTLLPLDRCLNEITLFLYCNKRLHCQALTLLFY